VLNAHDVVVSGSAEAVAPNVGWMGGTVTAIDDTSCLVHLVGEEPAWLAVSLAALATGFDVQLADGASAEMVDLVGRITGRLAAAGT